MDKPTMIEDFTDEMLEDLCDLITSVARKYKVKIKGIYLVGSIVFGLKEVNDIDVRIHGDHKPDHETLGKLRREISKGSELPYNIDTNIVEEWGIETRRSDLGFLVPYFDLVEKKLWYKHPYDTVPFNFGYVRDKDGNIIPRLVTYNKRSERQVRALLKMDRLDR